MARQQQRRQQQSKQDNGKFEEKDGFGTVWHRPDAADNQPSYTGEGLDPDGNPVRVALFTRSNDGKPYRSRNGVRFMRFHIEPPWEDDDPGAVDPEEVDEDDVPF